MDESIYALPPTGRSKVQKWDDLRKSNPKNDLGIKGSPRWMGTYSIQHSRVSEYETKQPDQVSLSSGYETAGYEDSQCGDDNRSYSSREEYLYHPPVKSQVNGLITGDRHASPCDNSWEPIYSNYRVECVDKKKVFDSTLLSPAGAAGENSIYPTTHEVANGPDPDETTSSGCYWKSPASVVCMDKRTITDHRQVTPYVHSSQVDLRQAQRTGLQEFHRQEGAVPKILTRGSNGQVTEWTAVPTRQCLSHLVGHLPGRPAGVTSGQVTRGFLRYSPLPQPMGPVQAVQSSSRQGGHVRRDTVDGVRCSNQDADYHGRDATGLTDKLVNHTDMNYGTTTQSHTYDGQTRSITQMSYKIYHRTYDPDANLRDTGDSHHVPSTRYRCNSNLIYDNQAKPISASCRSLGPESQSCHVSDQNIRRRKALSQQNNFYDYEWNAMSREEETLEEYSVITTLCSNGVSTGYNGLKNIPEGLAHDNLQTSDIYAIPMKQPGKPPAELSCLTSRSKPLRHTSNPQLWYASSEEGSGSEGVSSRTVTPQRECSGRGVADATKTCSDVETDSDASSSLLGVPPRSVSMPNMQESTTDIYSEALEAELYSFEDYSPGPPLLEEEPRIYSFMEDSWSQFDYSVIPNHICTHESSPVEESNYSAISSIVEETPKKVRVLPCQAAEMMSQDADKENDEEMNITPKLLKSVAGNRRSPFRKQSSQDSPWTASKEDSLRIHSSILPSDDPSLESLLHSDSIPSPVGSPPPWSKQTNMSPFSRSNRIGSLRRKKEQAQSPSPKMAWDVEDVDNLESRAPALKHVATCSGSIDSSDVSEVVMKKERSMSMPSPILPRSHSQEFQSSSPKLARSTKKAFSIMGFTQRASEGSIDIHKKSSLKKKWKKEQMDMKVLYHAIQQGNSKQVAGLLDAHKVDLSHVNSDGLSPLDFALGLKNEGVSRVLISHGARRNPEFILEPSNLSVCLVNMGNEAKVKVVYLQQSLAMMSVNEGSKDSAQYKEYCHLHMRWVERLQLINQMRENYQQTALPPAPSNVTLSAASTSSLLVQFDKPYMKNGDVITGYKVEWSESPMFETLLGEVMSQDPSRQEYHIGGLVAGRQYYVRVMACNIKGIGRPTHPDPAYAVPSTWREVDDVTPRAFGKWEQLENLLSEVMKMKSISDTSDINFNIPKEMFKKNSGRRLSLKTLFPAAPKFQKSLKQGLYFATVIYSEDRLLVTNSNQIPVLEVSDSYSQSNITSHFQWFSKMACTWQNVSTLLQDLDKSEASGPWPVRERLLQAVSDMQTTLGMRNLGQPYLCPLVDKCGSVVFVTVCHVEDRANIANSATRWTNLTKILKENNNENTPSVMEQLFMKTKDMIAYEQRIGLPLEKGLYLGYLKLQSSLDVIDVVTPALTPSCLPHVKISSNPNVSSEEWETIRKLSSSENTDKWSRQQVAFIEKLMEGSRRLSEMHGLSSEDALQHRLYDTEILELNSSVTMVVMMPPRDQVCSLPGQTDRSECTYTQTYLPLQTFEIVNMVTYRPELMRPYCRATCLLEVDHCLAQQAQRQALTNEEIDVARENCNCIAGLQKRLNETWRSMRWLSDLISYARSREEGITFQTINNCLKSQENVCDTSKVPVSKKLKSRACVNNSNTCISKGLVETPPAKKRTDPLQRVCSQESLRSSDSQETSSIASVDSLERNIQQIIEETCVESSDWDKLCHVYVALPGQASPGTEYEMNVQMDTTAEDAIDYVLSHVGQLCNGSSQVPDPQDCYLVAVIGNRERILRDRFMLRQLQKPWTNGRLFVRLRKDTLAALEMEQMISECV